MNRIAGENLFFQFITALASGAAANADALPIATATRNGVDDPDFVLAVSNLDAGRYLVSGVVPVGYLAGDQVQIVVAATIATVATKQIVASFVVLDPLALNQALADAILSRGVAGVEDAADTHSLAYVILALSEADTTTAAGKLTIFKSDGVTPFVQKNISAVATAAPITGVN